MYIYIFVCVKDFGKGEEGGEVYRRYGDASLHQMRLEPADAHADAVSLPRRLYWPAEHLDGLDLLGNLQIGQLD